MFLFVSMAISAQNPVTWTFTSKKLTDNSYEIRMTATIEKGWHLYSQAQPQDAIADPTTFTISNNPKNDKANTMNTRKKMILRRTFVEILLKISGFVSPAI